MFKIDALEDFTKEIDESKVVTYSTRVGMSSSLHSCGPWRRACTWPALFFVALLPSS